MIPKTDILSLGFIETENPFFGNCFGSTKTYLKFFTRSAEYFPSIDFFPFEEKEYIIEHVFYIMKRRNGYYIYSPMYKSGDYINHINDVKKFMKYFLKNKKK